jgi:hypothetical protein
VIQTSGVSIYPNPVQDKLNYSIDLGTDKSVVVQLFDAQGRTIEESIIRGRGLVKGVIDVTNYSNGIYVLSFISEHTAKRVTVHIGN